MSSNQTKKCEIVAVMKILNNACLKIKQLLAFPNNIAAREVYVNDMLVQHEHKTQSTHRDIMHLQPHSMSCVLSHGLNGVEDNMAVNFVDKRKIARQCKNTLVQIMKVTTVVDIILEYLRPLLWKLTQTSMICHHDPFCDHKDASRWVLFSSDAGNLFAVNLKRQVVSGNRRQDACTCKFAAACLQHIPKFINSKTCHILI